MMTFPANRAFAVLLSDETDPEHGHMTGRVEHVDSVRQGRFSSLEELWEFIADFLRKESVQ